MSHIVLRVALLVSAMAACGDTDPELDLRFRFGLDVQAPDDVRVTIDGIERRELGIVYSSESHASGSVVEVVVSDDDTVVATSEIEVATCDPHPPAPSAASRIDEGYTVCVTRCCRYWLESTINNHCDTVEETWQFTPSCEGYGICETGCNAIAQTGCQAGERCAPVFDAQLAGNEGCVPDADTPIPVGQPCTEGSQLAGGHDDCVARAVCVEGVCRELCSLEPDSCDAGTCQAYPGILDCSEGRSGVCTGP